MSGKRRICKITFRYDKRGNLIEEAYWDTENVPCLSKNGIARCKYEYDPQGNTLQTLFFNIDSLPYFNITDGFAGIKRTYNDKNQRISETGIGIDGKICM